jgi:phospholipid-translocating ATPase
MPLRTFLPHCLPYSPLISTIRRTAVLPMSPPAKRFSRFTTWYDTLTAFNVEDLFNRKREQAPPRTIFVNQDLPQDYYDHRSRVKKEVTYTSNQVITSKYTIITFVPRNLLEQFRRIANM